MRLSAFAIAIAIWLSGGADSLARAADRVTLSFDPVTGSTDAAFRRADGSVRDVLKLAPVTLDGRPQADFRAAAGGGSVLFNDAVRVELDPPGVGSGAMTWSALDGAAHEFEIAILDNSAYYGCGERFGSLNHKGLILPMVSIDRPEDKGSVTYKPVPFYMSTRGYAAWLDGAAPSTFDLNATDRERVLIRTRAARVRLVLIDGPGMAAMLDEFTRLSGRPRVPPAWSFAPWKSRNVHHNRDDVLADAELTRKHDLPGSVIVIDSPWETGYNDFVLNEKQFTEPELMFRRLRELGFYPCLWLTPFINVENVVDMVGITPGPTRNFAEAAERGLLVKQPDGQPMIVSWWKGRGALVDFTNPQAVSWWHWQIDQARRWGVRAFKCDDGEGNFVQDAVFADGTPAAEMKNRYAELYLKTAQPTSTTGWMGTACCWPAAGLPVRSAIPSAGPGTTRPASHSRTVCRAWCWRCRTQGFPACRSMATISPATLAGPPRNCSSAGRSSARSRR